MGRWGGAADSSRGHRPGGGRHGGEVLTFISTSDVGPDVEVELFFLDAAVEDEQADVAA